jgi:hypothetical protein
LGLFRHLPKTLLCVPAQEADDPAKRMTNGEEMFRNEKTRVKRVPIQPKKRLVCFGLWNIGRDEANFTFPERVADHVSRAIGSWYFVITQVRLLSF